MADGHRSKGQLSGWVMYIEWPRRQFRSEAATRPLPPPENPSWVRRFLRRHIDNGRHFVMKKGSCFNFCTLWPFQHRDTRIIYTWSEINQGILYTSHLPQICFKSLKLTRIFLALPNLQKFAIAANKDFGLVKCKQLLFRLCSVCLFVYILTIPLSGFAQNIWTEYMIILKCLCISHIQSIISYFWGSDTLGRDIILL